MADKSGLGLSKNTAGALSYVLGPISGLIFLVLDRDPYVRFHSMQSIVVFLALIILQWIFGLTIILLPLMPLVSILMFALWLLLIYKAWMGEEWEVPLLGRYAKKFLKKA